MTYERTYLSTHPWLTFSANLRSVAPRLWIALGECQAICEEIAHAALPPDAAETLDRLALAGGAHASAALAGNTLTADEVLRHLSHTLELPPSRRYLAEEIDTLVEVFRLVVSDTAERGGTELSPPWIQAVNRLALFGLPCGDNAVPGVLRDCSSKIGRYEGAPAEDCGYLLDRLCEWMNSPGFSAGEGFGITHAIIRAALAHLYLSWIRPFGDGNGRTARIIEFQILVTSGVPAVAAHLPAVHYYRTRNEYTRQLERAGETGGYLPFIEYVALGFRDGLRELLDRIRVVQRTVAWSHHVRERFADPASSSDLRRSRLVLDLALRSEPVSLSGIPLISTRLARDYALKTGRTLIRDLNALIGEGLVEKTSAGYRARREIVLSFTPPASAKDTCGPPGTDV